MRRREFSDYELSEARPAGDVWVPAGEAGRVTGEALVLRTEGGRFRILEIGPQDCLIEARRAAGLRGHADIFDGERQLATCLIVLAVPEPEPEGRHLRCTFKRRTPARSEPPQDFAR